MTLRCLVLVWHIHREPWRGVEFQGSGMAFTGGWMFGRQICRVNRQNRYEGCDGLLLNSFLKLIALKSLDQYLQLRFRKQS